MKRRLTPLLRCLLAKARRAGLPCPLGRAAYAVNRRYNGDRWAHDGRMRVRSDLEIMRKCRETTARRWADHYLAGGSLKALRYDAEEWNQLRRRRAAEDREKYRDAGPLPGSFVEPGGAMVFGQEK